MHFTFDIERGNFTDAGRASSSVKRTLKHLGVDPTNIKRTVVALFEAEINAIRDGFMLATAVQSPYNMGYMGCQTIYDLVKGNTKAEDYEKFIDTGATIVTTENVNDEEMIGVIDPFTLKKY